MVCCRQVDLIGAVGVEADFDPVGISLSFYFARQLVAHIEFGCCGDAIDIIVFGRKDGLWCLGDFHFIGADIVCAVCLDGNEIG